MEHPWAVPTVERCRSSTPPSRSAAIVSGGWRRGRRVVHPGEVASHKDVDPAVSARMARTGGRDTSCEMAVRRELHRRGMRYRVSYRPVGDLRRTADIVFIRQRIAVLIDGCFWHGCPTHYRPATGARRQFWASKIAENRRRDRDSTDAFVAAGWIVLRFWEHEDPVVVADRVVAAVRSARMST